MRKCATFQPEPLSCSHKVPISLTKTTLSVSSTVNDAVWSERILPKFDLFAHNLLASSTLVTPANYNAIVDSTTAAPTTTFEPMLPDTTALFGFVSIVIVCAIAAWVWANQVVPVSRTKLALSKKNGPVKEYLDELMGVETRQLEKQQQLQIQNEETLVVSESTLEGENSPPIAVPNNDNSNNNNNRALERWLFTDWLQNNKSASTPGRQKEPALPVLKNAKWNSGDNPILAATALILVGVTLTALVERIESLFS